MFGIEPKFLFSKRNDDETQILSYNLYREILGDSYAPFISSIMTCRRRTESVASAMVCFPQINFINNTEGSAQVIATDSAWRNWKTTLNTMMGMDTMQYYTGITSTDNYIIATYMGMPIIDSLTPGHGSHLHVFDWNGKFLLDVSVKEDLGQVAFDSSRKILYCIESTEGNIIRYDLSMYL